MTLTDTTIHLFFRNPHGCTDCFPPRRQGAEGISKSLNPQQIQNPENQIPKEAGHSLSEWHRIRFALCQFGSTYCLVENGKDSTK
jgi:hypothetical protein